MDSLETTSHDKNMEATATNEDVLVLLQTESGEQIHLSLSALPSDFVPGDSAQIIMVESALDEQQQEVVVESSDTAESQSNADNLLPVQVDANSLLTPTAITTNDSLKHSTDVVNHQVDIPIIETQLPNSNSVDKPVPRTYSKSNLVKSYAPTCGATRIYQQAQTTPSNSLNQIELDNVEPPTQEAPTHEASIQETSAQDTSTQETPTPEVLPKLHKKQKRKETLLTRPLNEEDLKLEFQIIEPLPTVPEIEVKCKPRKKYQTKKMRVAMEKLSKEEVADGTRDLDLCERDLKGKRQEVTKKEELHAEVKDEVTDVREHECQVEAKKEISRRELPRRGAIKDKPIETLPIKPQQPQTERRTRLSNTCRVATGKSYKCNDCDFSTDRINNIILHVKENCPKLRKT